MADVDLDQFSAGLTMGGGGGAGAPSILVTTTSGSAGIAALDALTPAVGNLGIIGLGTNNEVLVEYGTLGSNNGWYRKYPFQDQTTNMTLGSAGSFVEQIPTDGDYSETTGSGAITNYNVTVAGKVYAEPASSTDSTFVYTTRTNNSNGAAIITRGIKFTALSGSGDDSAGTIALNPNTAEGATWPLLLLGARAGGYYRFVNSTEETVITGSTLDPFTSNDIEIYLSSSNRTVVYKDWEGAPIFDAVENHLNSNAAALLGLVAFDDGLISGSLECDAQYGFDFTY